MRGEELTVVTVKPVMHIRTARIGAPPAKSDTLKRYTTYGIAAQSGSKKHGSTLSAFLTIVVTIPVASDADADSDSKVARSCRARACRAMNGLISTTYTTRDGT